MTIERWTLPIAPTWPEQFIPKRLGRARKLLGFLRLHRHEWFDDALQVELASMYRTTGATKEARPPAMMAMAMLVQGYLRISYAGVGAGRVESRGSRCNPCQRVGDRQPQGWPSIHAVASRAGTPASRAVSLERTTERRQRAGRSPNATRSRRSRLLRRRCTSSTQRRFANRSTRRNGSSRSSMTCSPSSARDPAGGRRSDS